MSQPYPNPMPLGEPDGIRLARVETEIRALRADISEVRTDVRDMRTAVMTALTAQTGVQERCMSLLSSAGQAILKPSTGLLVLVGMLLLAAGLVTAGDLVGFWSLIPAQP